MSGALLVGGRRTVVVPDDELVSDVLREAAATLRGVELDTLLRHVRGRRATWEATRTAAPLDAPERVVVKVFVSPRARGNARRLRALASTRAGVLVPSCVAVDDTGRVAVLTYRRGTVLDAAADDAFVRGCGAAGAALAVLHGSGAVLDRAHTADDEVSHLERSAAAGCEDVLAAVLGAPAVRALLSTDEGTSVGASDEGAAGGGAAPALVPSHRDLHTRQVVLGDAPEAAFIDLDDAAMAPPGLDVGNMVAHLRRDALAGRRSAEVARRAEAAFLVAYGTAPAHLDAWVLLSLGRLASLALERHRDPVEHRRICDAVTAAVATDARAPQHRAHGVATGAQGVVIETGHADRPVRVVDLRDERSGAARRVVVKRFVPSAGASVGEGTASTGAAAYETLRALWASPFGAVRTPPGLPEPLGCDPVSGELTMAWLDGPPLAVRGSLGQALARATEAGVLLADLHGSGVVPQRRRSSAALVRSVHRKAAERSAHPLGDELRRVCELIAATIPDDPGLPETSIGPRCAAEAEHRGLALEWMVPSHGDCSPRNVLCTAEGLRFIDFDRFQLAHRWRDVAYWSAWLWVTRLTIDGRADWTDAQPFVAAYAARAGVEVHARPREHLWLRAVALVRIVHGWSALRDDTVTAKAVLDEAARLLRPALGR